MKRLVILLTGLLSITSFQNPKETEWVKFRYPYFGITISLPSFLELDEKSANGQDNKSISFRYPSGKFNVTIFMDSKQEIQQALLKNNLGTNFNNLNFYTELNLANFKKNFSVSSQSEITETTINGMRAKIVNLKATFWGNDESFYTMACAETDNVYYRLMVSIPSDKRAFYSDEIRRIIYSLDKIQRENTPQVANESVREKPKIERYNVKGAIRTNLYLERGEKVNIAATGRVTFGVFAGSGGPTGIQGFEIYNIVKNYRHGSLLATIGDNGAWHYVGRGTIITADNSGYLKLYVNDLDPSNNSGSFTVECRKSN
ncbi:hypothetical protein D1164_22440 [Mariniphaga sediminis]|uniref:Uncharacterized protein n=1 Tax=Mariniphaga sediminis TaxID=1628158 RepID=A0A399CTK1_9BACT|nr:hypothetical protein [Mariniphaga sediminis]RIH62907.1 hypothetical protein D1164_22440 [Mariniphaga sediminis]